MIIIYIILRAGLGRFGTSFGIIGMEKLKSKHISTEIHTLHGHHLERYQSGIVTGAHQNMLDKWQSLE
ncbi:hypothetical protein [Neobacillus cucumis]|uniref:hypothetical protein n=1 Tax=Neobacillus cucumis TaxID=1740721 RepID=UPI0028536579|nr:hypothetical protein [Neobacillus cucumis]MDR4947191.1 hypothetical protein [Neobacillus cucumis]